MCEWKVLFSREQLDVMKGNHALNLSYHIYIPNRAHLLLKNGFLTRAELFTNLVANKQLIIWAYCCCESAEFYFIDIVNLVKFVQVISFKSAQ